MYPAAASLSAVAGSGGGADFTSTRCRRPSVPASQAARLSEVTSQLSAISGRPNAIALGSQTGTRPRRRSRAIDARLAAGRRAGCSPHSIRPYCSIASRAMRWAVASSKGRRRWASRTWSAKGPPAGTTMARPPPAASAASHSVSAGTKARLPPSLTTTPLRPISSLTVSACGVAIAVRRSRAAGRGQHAGPCRAGAAAALDLDADAGRRWLDLELGDADAGLDHPWLREAQLGDRLGQRLDQVDVPAIEQRLNAGDDGVVGDDIGEVVVARTGILQHQQVDIDLDALLGQVLVRIDPDAAGQDEVAHEHAIGAPAGLDVVGDGHLFGQQVDDRHARADAPLRRSRPRRDHGGNHQGRQSAGDGTAMVEDSRADRAWQLIETMRWQLET